MKLCDGDDGLCVRLAEADGRCDEHHPLQGSRLESVALDGVVAPDARTAAKLAEYVRRNEERKK